MRRSANSQRWFPPKQPTKTLLKNKTNPQKTGNCLAVSSKINSINRMRGLPDHPLRVFVPPGTRHSEDMKSFVNLQLLEIVYMDYEEPPPPVLHFKLRDFQVEALKFLASNPRALIEAPTGAGKTLVFTEHIKTLLPRTAIVVSPTKFLVDQTASRLEEAGLKCRRAGFTWRCQPLPNQAPYPLSLSRGLPWWSRASYHVFKPRSPWSSPLLQLLLSRETLASQQRLFSFASVSWGTKFFLLLPSSQRSKSVTTWRSAFKTRKITLSTSPLT